MNLYLITQSHNTGYDTFDSAIVAAASEDDARLIEPREGSHQWDETWTEPEHVSAKLVGIAADGIKAGTVICASYNAG